MNDHYLGPINRERTAFQEAIDARPEYAGHPINVNEMGTFRLDVMQHSQIEATSDGTSVVQKLHAVVQDGKRNYGVIEVMKAGERAGFVLSLLGDNMALGYAVTDQREATVYGVISEEVLKPVATSEETPGFYIGIYNDEVVVGNIKPLNQINVVTLVQEPQPARTPDPLTEINVWAPEPQAVLYALSPQSF